MRDTTDAIAEKASQLAEEHYNKDFYSLSEHEQREIWTIAEAIILGI
jgi:hypothetical protein